jgi:hypothetical protein
MKHEHRYPELPSRACADSTSSAPASEEEDASAEARGIHQVSQFDTAWDNWKSVRDVG